MSSPGMRTFKRFHESFNVSLKITAVGIDWVADRATEGEGFQDAFRNSVRRAAPVWGEFVPRDPAQATHEARRDVAVLGIVGVFSAFEEYLDSLKPYAAARGGHVLRAKLPTPLPGAVHRHDKAHYAVAEVKLTVRELDDDRPMLAFFRELRNCVAHSRGVASTELVEIARAPEFAKAVETWPITLRARKKGRALPTLPTPVLGKPVPLLPEHSIHASAVCFRLVEAIDAKLTIQFG